MSVLDPTKKLKPNPDLLALLEKAKAKWDAMSPEKKREEMRKQRKSWVIGEMMLDRPEMTREEAERIYNEIILW